VKRAFYTTGLQTLLRQFRPSNAPVILRYHSISDGSVLISKGITVSLENFEEQVHYFVKNFYVIKMSELVEYIRKREKFPQNALVFTFDDGYRDNYEAAKILHRYGASGMFYITAGCIESAEKFWVAEIRHLLALTRHSQVHVSVGERSVDAAWHESVSLNEAIRKLTHLIKTVDVSTREDIRSQLWSQFGDVPTFPSDLMLTWQQLRDMVAMGMEIGGHTMTHCNLPSATTDEAWYEISVCKSLLENQLDIEVKHFAYPNGGSVQHYDNRIKELVEKAGYLSASTSKPALITMEADLFELRRMRATEHLFEMLWEIA
jgi:peptidoglycan/xylan/chitin deacetylase (PgdA/CDA1 family)